MSRKMPIRCRCCFGETNSGEAYSVEGLVSVDAVGTKLSLSLLLEVCIGINAGDLPSGSTVCLSCYNEIVRFYKFRLKAMDTHGRYNQLMDEIKVKIELLDVVQPDSQPDPLNNPPELDLDLDETASIKSSIKSDNEDELTDPTTKPGTSHQNLQVEKVPAQGSRSHLRRQWKKLGFEKNEKGEFPCPHCPGIFYRPSHLCDHINWKHSNQSVFPCEVCGLLFDAYPPLKRHVRENHIEKPYTCDICGAKYEVIATLRTHMKLKHINGGKRVNKKIFACNICNKIFKDSSNYRRHNARKHNDGHEIKPYPCRKCGKSWRNAFELQLHERSKHSETRDFVCALCDKAFKTPSYLKTHYSTVHSERRDICCDQCGKKFKTTTILNAHLESHYTDKRFVCDICNAAFKQKSSLTAHKAKHKDEMSGIVFRCEYCEKVVKSRASLLHHIKLHIGKDLPCPHCEKIYKNPDSLKRHIQSNHQGVKWRHVCLLCDKELWDKSQIIKHIESEHVLAVAASGKPSDKFVKRVKVQDSGPKKPQRNLLSLVDLDISDIKEPDPEEQHFVLIQNVTILDEEFLPN